MDLVDMICQTSQLLTDIRKCQSLYHYCEDKKAIYEHIVKEICFLKDEDVLLYFVNERFNEESSLEVLRIELLRLYKILADKFLGNIQTYAKPVEVICS